MTRKGRTAAVLLGALCLTVLAVGTFALRGRIVEQWYLWKLGSSDQAESDRAASKLGEMGSLRAVGPLIESVQRADPSIEPLFRAAPATDVDFNRVELSSRAYALYQLGAGAIPLIERVLASEPSATSVFILKTVRDAIQGRYSQVDLKGSADLVPEEPRKTQ